MVAVAAVHNATVITNEDIGFEHHPGMKQRKLKNYTIANVCHDEDIRLVRSYGLLQREGWVFEH